jgi:pseudaminic acid cytidylyltransferase
MSALALIPARGGSKRLPRKNILPFAGKPMLAWTVEAARAAGVFERVLVSTDDAEIAAVARQSGAEVLMRPARVSDDAATLVDVVQHAFGEGRQQAESFCLLLANCPLRGADDIRASHQVFRSRQPAALLSVVSYGWTPPFRAQLVNERRLEPAFEDWIRQKSQKYPEVVCPTGAIYWSTPRALERTDTLYIPGIESYPMPWHRGVDIDTREDFELAACIRHSLDHGFRFGDGA